MRGIFYALSTKKGSVFMIPISRSHVEYQNFILELTFRMNNLPAIIYAF